MLKRIPQNVIGVVYDSNHFTHSKESKKFISEISETPAVLRQLWNDSLDCGFGIKSVKTGNIVLWTLWEIQKDGEGDTLAWIFRPDSNDPSLAGYTAEILND